MVLKIFFYLKVKFHFLTVFVIVYNNNILSCKLPAKLSSNFWYLFREWDFDSFV